jgi:hypothetical protein
MGYVSVIALAPGVGCGIFGAVDAIAHRPGGLVGVLVGLAITAAAIVTLVRVSRRYRQTVDLEWQELRARGEDDGLPMGVFREGQRVGLEASDLWQVVATLMGAFGLLFVFLAITESPEQWWVGVSISLLFFGVAALFVRRATGVHYWLTPEGISRRNKRHHAVQWSGIGRVVPMLSGATIPMSSAGVADAFVLQTLETANSPARRWRWRAGGFTLHVAFVEVGGQELMKMIHERIRPHT